MMAFGGWIGSYSWLCRISPVVKDARIVIRGILPSVFQDDLAPTYTSWLQTLTKVLMRHSPGCSREKSHRNERE